MTRAYLAGSYARREEFQLYVPLLEAVGLEVVSTWLSGAHGMADGVFSSAELGAFAAEDLMEIVQASVFITFTEHPDAGPERRTGGRHVELGYALGVGAMCVVIGPTENVFHHLAGVMRFDSLGEFLEGVGGVGVEAQPAGSPA